MKKWKSVENNILKWLASTASGSIVKVALGACLAWLADHIADYSLPPILLVAITAAIPTVINVINSKDSRYGVGSDVIKFEAE